MDNNTVFVRTSKGEDEMHSRTMHLPGDIKRALLMVDGTATYGEISKRAAPSLRAGLEAMLQELEKEGYIADKSKASNIPKMSIPTKMSMPLKMATPAKMPTPQKIQPVDENAGDLDFLSGFGEPSPKAAEIEPPPTATKAEQEEAEETKEKIEAAKLKAQQEAEAMLQKAAQEAARIREEAEREKQRVAAKAKAEAEAQARALIEAKARQEIEAARLQAQQEAEAARLKAEQEVAKAREEAAAALRARQKAEAMLIKSVQNTAQAKDLDEAVRPRSSATTTSRSTSATVLFFDVVGYTKQPVNKQIEIKKQFNQLVSTCLKVAVDGESIILDTGDGAAIGFLQHPEDALEVAIKFRNAVIANKHQDYPDLKVRIGIHLGPINIAKDMNGRSNMVGDGINDAQRVMSFAGIDEIYISRPYYDFISRLRDEYADMFRYRGMQEDKHGREHPVYAYVEAAPSGRGLLSQAGGSASEAQQPNPFYSSTGQTSAAKPDTFSFDAFHIGELQPPAEQRKPVQSAQQARLAGTSPAGKPETFSFDSFNIETPQPPAELPKKEKVSPAQRTAESAEAQQPARHEAATPAAGRPPASTSRHEEIDRATQERIAAERRMEEEALAEKRLAEARAKARAEAAQHAAEAARAEVERAARQDKYTVESAPAAKPARVARARRKPFSLGRLVGFFFKLGAFLLVLLAIALFVVPYALPTRDYVPRIEKFISAEVHQAVHIGHLSVRLLPTPRLELGEVYIGKAKQFQAEKALIDFALKGLIIDAKPIDSIELQGIKVNGAALQGVSAWLQQLAADDQYPVARIVISQGTLDADAFQFTGVEGTLDFNNVGEFAKANLRSNGGKYMLDINAALGNKLQVAIKVRDSSLPLLPDWQFDELTAKGQLSNADLSISQFEGRILGGVLQGNANFNWRAGWVAQGTMSTKTMPMRRLSKFLDGNVEGSARFKMSSANLADLAGSAVLDGNFMAKSGVISGMDIVATARSRSKEHLPGGRTHFDEFSGMVAYADNALHVKQAKIVSNVLNAIASFDIEKQQISGSVTARLTLEDGVKPVELHIGGTTDSPTLRFSP